MKTNNNPSRKSSKKILIIVTAIIILLGAGTAVYAYVSNNQETRSQTESKPQVNLDTNTSTATNVDTKPDTNDSQPSDTTTPKDQLPASITSSGVSDGSVQVRVLIGEAVGTGACTFTATQGQKQVVKTAKIQPLASSSTCQGFTIPTTEFTSGDWSFTIDISTDAKAAHLTGTFRE